MDAQSYEFWVAKARRIIEVWQCIFEVLTPLYSIAMSSGCDMPDPEIRNPGGVRVQRTVQVTNEYSFQNKPSDWIDALARVHGDCNSLR